MGDMCEEKCIETLSDTFDLMCSKDYKDRFRAEYYQTKIRYEKLHKMPSLSVNSYGINESVFI